jgi:N-acyl-D-aspartate/D-glutamate deacylase
MGPKIDPAHIHMRQFHLSASGALHSLAPSARFSGIEGIVALPWSRLDNAATGSRMRSQGIMLDLKITGGRIVDGTGRDGFAGDVGVKDGRIVAVGDCPEPAARTIDAGGRVVAPGFIDAHTHYDAQVFWDPTLSPSCFHGVTTIFGGFCGFSIAPLNPGSADYLQRMLARVEGMPLATLQAAVPWDWSSFGDFLSRIDGNAGLNAGFFAGHSAIRRVVMGERAVGEKANAEELDRMKSLLDKCLREGAMGFSSTVSAAHNDGDGNPVPSRWADRSELMELAAVVRDHEGTGLELLPDLDFGPGAAEMLADFSIAGNRPVNWNALLVSGRPTDEEFVRRRLAVTDHARSLGGEVIALTLPNAIEAFMSYRSGAVFDSFPGKWREIFKWPVEQRIRELADPALRKQLAEDAASLPPDAQMAPLAVLANYTVASVKSDENAKYKGRKISEIADAEGKPAIDAMLDIALADDLDTLFTPNVSGDDYGSYALRGRIWDDDRTLIGGSDAGAHLDLADTFAYSTALLQHGVRKHKVISLEKAIQKITQRPAQYFGLVDRGTIAPGSWADIVIFDPETVGRGPTYSRHDLPGGGGYRLYADAIGIDHVFVNGVQIVQDGEHSGALPGKVLRSGQDTRTVPMNALRAD